MKRKSFDKTGIAVIYCRVDINSGSSFSLNALIEFIIKIIPFIFASYVSFHRIFREKQYAERRLKDFDDALTREAVRDIIFL